VAAVGAGVVEVGFDDGGGRVLVLAVFVPAEFEVDGEGHVEMSLLAKGEWQEHWFSYFSRFWKW